jgi:hypothetical protein
MTAEIENVAGPRIRSSTERVRKHRERRRNGLRLMTVEMLWPCKNTAFVARLTKCRTLTHRFTVLPLIVGGSSGRTICREAMDWAISGT